MHDRKFSANKKLSSLTNSFTKASEKFLYEYIDLKNIIHRLQDLDKLKKILLNESQIFFFDMIPKPQAKENFEKSSRFMEKQIRHSKINNMNKKLILEHYEKLHENSSFIDQKIVSLIDDETKYRINFYAKNGNYKQNHTFTSMLKK